ncbi:MAG: hypothetical protein AB7V44_27810 [Pseudonocardia sp.]
MTPLQMLLSTKLGDLDAFVTRRRDAGKSWRAIALEIRDQTGIEVTNETLRSWSLERAS